jgi:exodeoxyribonuclease VII large subunit
MSWSGRSRVQGEGAAEQVATAIRGFNALEPGGPIPRPDVLIVARGGGSIEDLMAFNEEIVVRAAAESAIPLVSAVGHETDTTLIDFAADKRAPTPTAAAEMVVPVRQELMARLARDAASLEAGLARAFDEARARLRAAALGDPARLIEERVQRLDERGERLKLAGAGLIDRRRRVVVELGARLPDPKTQLERAKGALARLGGALAANANAQRVDARARNRAGGRACSTAPRTRASRGHRRARRRVGPRRRSAGELFLQEDIGARLRAGDRRARRRRHPSRRSAPSRRRQLALRRRRGRRERDGRGQARRAGRHPAKQGTLL